MNTIVHMYIVKYTSGICSHINAYNCICAYVLCNWQFIWIVAVMGTFFQTRSRSTDCLVQSTSMTQAALRSEGIQSTSISNNSTSKFFIIIFLFYLPNCLSLVTRFFFGCAALRCPASPSRFRVLGFMWRMCNENYIANVISNNWCISESWWMYTHLAISALSMLYFACMVECSTCRKICARYIQQSRTTHFMFSA